MIEEKYVNQMVTEVIGYDREKGYIKVQDKVTGEKVTIVVDKGYAKSDFASLMANESSNRFTPPGSIVIFSRLKSLSDSGNFFKAGIAQPVTKKTTDNLTYITPVKLYDKAVGTPNNKLLMANVMDADYINVRDLSTLGATIIRAFNGDTGAIKGGNFRAVMVRVGYASGPTDKHLSEFFITPQKNQTIEQALKEYKTTARCRRMFESAKKVAQDKDGLIEVVGITRAPVNDFNNPANIESYLNDNNFKQTFNNKRMMSFALCAVSVNNQGRIDKCIALNSGKPETSFSGTLGRHAGEVSLPFHIKPMTDAPSEVLKEQGNPEYPLFINDVISESSGKRLNIRISGNRSDLDKYTQRILSAVPGFTPHRASFDNSFIFPVEFKQQVSSSLSDLTGAPALFTQSSKLNEGNLFSLRGHVDKRPFATKIDEIKKAYPHKVHNNQLYFKESDRVAIEAQLGELLSEPLSKTKISSIKFSGPSYAQWMEERYRNNPTAMMWDMHELIRPVAHRNGIDWDKTVSNITLPGEGGTYLFKKNDIARIGSEKKKRHSVSASVYPIELTDKATGNKHFSTGFSLTFRDLSKAEPEKITWAEDGYLFQQYRRDVSGKETQLGEYDKNYLAEVERQNQERINKEIEKQKTISVKARKEAAADWARGKPETGSHRHLIEKGIGDIVNHVDIRRLDGRNASYMYPISNIKKEFVGLQKIYEQVIPYIDSNKVYTEGMTRVDIETGLPYGLHHAMGDDDGSSPILFTEGFSDAASIFLATNAYVVNALDKHNKQLTIAAFRRVYPERKLIDIADNDLSNNQGNVGVLAALDASWNSGSFYIIPPPKDQDGFDINELFQKEGAQSINKLLQKPTAPPKNLMEYLSIRMKHVATSRFEQELEVAVNRLKNRYPSLSDEKIHFGLNTKGLRGQLPQRQKLVEEKQAKKNHKKPSLVAESAPVSLQQPTKEEAEDTNDTQTDASVSKNTIPIEVSIERNSSGKAYSFVKDNTGTLHSEIEAALSELMPDTAPMHFNGGYAAPAQLKNALNARLFAHTGAPQFYLSQSKKGQGFVIRGHFDAVSKEEIKNALGIVQHAYSDEEKGIVVKDTSAFHLVSDVLHKQLSPAQKMPSSFDIETIKTIYTPEVTEDLKKVCTQFKITPIELNKATALLRLNNDLPETNTSIISAIYAKTIKEQNFSTPNLLGRVETYKNALIAALTQAHHISLAKPDYIDDEALQKLVYNVAKKYAPEAYYQQQKLDEQQRFTLPENNATQLVSTSQEAADVPSTARSVTDIVNDVEKVVAETLRVEKEQANPQTSERPSTKQGTLQTDAINLKVEARNKYLELTESKSKIVSSVEKTNESSRQLLVLTTQQDALYTASVAMEQSAEKLAIKEQEDKELNSDETTDDHHWNNALEFLNDTAFTDVANNIEAQLNNWNDFNIERARTVEAGEDEYNIKIKHIKFPGGDEIYQENWFKNGELHRNGDAPAVIELEVSGDSKTNRHVHSTYEAGKLIREENLSKAALLSDTAEDNNDINVASSNFSDRVSDIAISVGYAAGYETWEKQLKAINELSQSNKLAGNEIIQAEAITSQTLHERTLTAYISNEPAAKELHDTQQDILVSQQTKKEEEEIHQLRLFNFIEDIEREPDSINEVTDEIALEDKAPTDKSSIILATNIAEHHTVDFHKPDQKSPVAKEHVEAVVENSDITRANDRIGRFVELARLFAAEGYEHDEFFDSVMTSPESPYLSNELANKDIHQLHKSGLDAWPYSTKPRTLSGFFNTVRADIAKERIEGLKQFIYDYVTVKGSTQWTWFYYYLNHKKLDGMTLRNPYVTELVNASSGEIELGMNNDLYNADIELIHDSFRTDKITPRVMWEEITEKVAAERSEEEALSQTASMPFYEDESETDIVLEIIGNKVQERRIEFSNGTSQAVYGMLDDIVDVRDIKTQEQLSELLKDTRRIATPTQIKAIGNNSEKIVLSKIEIKNHTIYSLDTTQSDKKERQFYNDFMVANGHYQRLSQPIIAAEESVKAQAREDLKLYTSTPTELHSEPTEVIEQRTVENRLDALMDMMAKAATNEMFYPDFYSEAFKEEGVYFDNNPYLLAETSRLDKKALRDELIGSGFKSLKAMYESIYSGVNSTQSTGPALARVGGYIKNNYSPAQDMPFRVEFESLAQLLGENLTPNNQILLPFNDFVKTPLAMIATNDVFAVPIHRLELLVSEGTITKDQLLLLADVHQVNNVASGSTKEQVAKQIQSLWSVRRTIAQLSIDEIAALPENELERTAQLMGVQMAAHVLATAQRIEKRHQQMQTESAIRMAQYAYIKEIISHEDAGLRIPKYVFTDVAKFNLSRDVGLIDLAEKISEKATRHHNYAKLKELSTVISNMSLDDIREHAEAEYKDRVIVGIDNPKYVSKLRFHYRLPEGQRSDNAQFDSEVRYHVLLDEKTLGLPNPIENEELARKSWQPLNNNAIEWSLHELSRYLDNYGVVAFESDTKDTSHILLIKTGEQYISRTVDTSTTPLNIKDSTAETLSVAIETIIGKTRAMVDMEPLLDELVLNTAHPLSKTLEKLNRIQDYKGPTPLNAKPFFQLDSYQQQFNGEEPEIGLAAFSHQLSITIRENIQSYLEGKSLNEAELLFDSETLAAIDQVHAPISNASLNHEVSATQNENSETDSIPVETFNKQYVGMRAVIENVSGQIHSGVIEQISDETVILTPQWLYDLRQSSVQDKHLVIDSKTGEKHFNKSFADYAKLEIARTVPDVFNIINVAEDKIEGNVSSSSLVKINELARLLGVEIHENRDSTVGKILNEIKARRIALIAQQSPELLTSGEKLEFFEYSQVLASNSAQWIAARQTITLSNTLELNYEKMIDTAKRFGFDRGNDHITDSTSFSLKDKKIGQIAKVINDLDILNEVSNYSVLEITKRTTPAAIFITEQYFPEITQLKNDYDESVLDNIKLCILPSKRWFESKDVDYQYPTLSLATEAVYEANKEAWLFADSQILLSKHSSIPRLETLAENVYPRDTSISIYDNGDIVTLDIDEIKLEQYQPGLIPEIRENIREQNSGPLSDFIQILDDIESLTLDTPYGQNLNTMMAIEAEKTSARQILQTLQTSGLPEDCIQVAGVFRLNANDKSTTLQTYSALFAAIDEIGDPAIKEAIDDSTLQNSDSGLHETVPTETPGANDFNGDPAHISGEQSERIGSDDRQIPSTRKGSFNTDQLSRRSERSVRSSLQSGIRHGAERSDGATRLAKYKFSPGFMEAETWNAENRIRMNISAIQISKELAENASEADHNHKDILAKYSGWGGLSGFFSNEYKYFQERKTLLELVGTEDFKAIQSATLTSYYTRPELYEQVWKAAERVGFRGGRALEPAAGIGSALSTIPDEYAPNTLFTARELDPTSARIGRLLHGEDVVKQQAYEKAELPNNHFDIAISNIPFGNYSVYDPKYAGKQYLIHDFFFQKSIDKVTANGLVCFITSTGTLDKQSNTFRKELNQKAELLGAIRLPNGMFSEYGGTNVATDLILLRKRDKGEDVVQDASWIDTQEAEVKNMSGEFEYLPVNKYFIKNPNMIVGDLRAYPGQYGPKIGSKMPEGNVYELINKAIHLLPENVLSRSPKVQKENTESSQSWLPDLANNSRIREGSFVVTNGMLGVAVNQWNNQIDDYQLAVLPAELHGKKSDAIKNLVQLRDTVRNHIEVQLETQGDDKRYLESRATLNEQYDAFIQKFDSIEKYQSAFKADPDAAIVFALETVDSSGNVFKADIFDKRTGNQSKIPEHFDDTEEALVMCVAHHGRILPEQIEKWTNKTFSQVLSENDGRIFNNPQTGQFELSEHYLAGNVRAKLKEAESATEVDPQYQNNVDALKDVIPQPLPLEDVKYRLGSSWIPERVLEQFVFYIATGTEDLTDKNDSIHVVKGPAGYSVSISDGIHSSNRGRIETDFGTPAMNAITLIEKVLNGSKIELKKKLYDGRTVTDSEATARAVDKAKLIATTFKDWVQTNQNINQALCDTYNDKYNCFVEKSYDGSRIQYTGLNPLFQGKAFEPRNTQKNALLRYLIDGSVLLDHDVGAGKSFELASIAIEGKARGVHNKPLIGAPNNVYGQLGRMIQEHYPNAKVAMIDPDDMKSDNRKRFTAQIANNDYDVVVMAHSTLNLLSTGPEFKSSQMRAQIEELRDALSNDSHDASSARRSNHQMIERRIKTLENKLAKLAKDESKDQHVYLEELGIDALLIDEADAFLNVPFVTNMGHVSGVNTSESQRATNMLYNVRYIQGLHEKDGGIVFATGTPIRKSMADMFVNLYFLAPTKLKEIGLYNHDDFMSVFGEVVSKIEVTPEGTGYRENSRLSKFNNLPELCYLYRTVADVVTSEMAGVKKPKHDDIHVNVPQNEYFKAFMADIARRASDFRNGSKDEVWFAIQSDAKKAAMDMRLVNSNIPVGEDTKIVAVSNNVHEEYLSSRDKKSAQVIFLDGYVNETDEGFSVYDALIDELTKRGIPKEEIIDSRALTSPSKKAKFEVAMREPKYAVVLGTTEKIGVGNNYQKHLIAMHGVNPSWNPRDMIQRLGRILRHGNLNEKVRVYQYASQDSFDLFQWDTIQRKAYFIAQARLDPKNAPREFSEDTDATPAQMMAIATGNDLIKTKIEADSKLDELERAKRAFEHSKNYIRSSISHLSSDIKYYEKHHAKYSQHIEMANKADTGVINGKSISCPKELGNAYRNIIQSELDSIGRGEKPNPRVELGKCMGHNIKLFFNGEDYSLAMDIGSVETIISNDVRPGYILGRVSAQVKEWENKITQHEKSIEECKTQIVSYESSLTGAFPQLDELREQRILVADLDRQLMEAANERKLDGAQTVRSFSELVDELTDINTQKQAEKNLRDSLG